MDYIKCDDICNTDNWEQASPRAYAGRHEIEMLRRAIQKCGRPVVLSLSPGPALIDKAWHYARYADMWRITDDMWDRWDHVKAMFARCELWQNHVRPGCWPDCDMLPLGKIGKGFSEERDTRLTRDEQRTLMTLWCVFGSPLMIGAELTRLDGWTASLLTNRRVLELLDGNRMRRQLCRDEEKAVWTSRAPDGELCAAIFNLSDGERQIALPLAELEAGGGITGAEELWTGERTEASGGSVTARVPAHGCKLFQIL